MNESKTAIVQGLFLMYLSMRSHCNLFFFGVFVVSKPVTYAYQFFTRQWMTHRVGNCLQKDGTLHKVLGKTLQKQTENVS